MDTGLGVFIRGMAMKKRLVSIFMIILVTLSACATGYITNTEKNEIQVTERAMSPESSNTTKIVINPESEKPQTTNSSVSQPASGSFGGQDPTQGFTKGEDTASENIERMPVEDVVIGNVSEYFPLIMNSFYYYKSESGQSLQRYLQYVRFEENKEITQLRISGEGFNSVNVIELTSDSVKLVYQADKAPFRENIIGRTPNTGLVILKAPLEKGHKWESNGIEAEIISTDKKITVNQKEMKAIVVRLFNTNGEVYDISYIKNLGPYSVTRFKSDDKSVIQGNGTTLLEFTSLMYNQSEKIPIKFYFPEGTGKYSEFEKEIFFDTNDVTRTELKDSYVAIAKAQGKPFVLNEESRIQFLFIKDGAVHMDLNDAFINYVNSHPEEEKGILAALIKTMTELYKTDRLYLTVNDQRYESNSLKIEKHTELNSHSFID